MQTPPRYVISFIIIWRAYLERLDWADYKKLLTGWTAGCTQLEFTEFQISEVGNRVFQEIGERHRRGGASILKNGIAVYKFDADQKLVHLDIYEQATDSGDWVRGSATTAKA